LIPKKKIGNQKKKKKCLSVMPSESIRRRTRGSTSSNYTAVLPNLLDANEPRYDLEPSSYSTSSSHIHPDASFLLGDDVEDVQADVLYPRFSTGNSDQSVDMAAFDSMVKDHQRKMSTGSLHLTRTLSRQNKLYGSDSKHARPAVADRYKIYTTQRGTGCTSLAHLLTERGKQALSEVVKNKGWWLDVVSPTPDEMAVISKVKSDKFIYIPFITFFE
jgi:magnesium transporter